MYLLFTQSSDFVIFFVDLLSHMDTMETWQITFNK